VQITLKLQPGLPSLRTPALKACVEQAIDAGHERFGMRLLQHTLEKDGLSLLVTAPHRRALSRGIQGISVRIARAVNRKLERKGRLFADRYDAQLVSSSSGTEVAGKHVTAKPVTAKPVTAKPVAAKQVTAKPLLGKVVGGRLGARRGGASRAAASRSAARGRRAGSGPAVSKVANRKSARASTNGSARARSASAARTGRAAARA
jgi:hypothetical protein